MVFFSGNIPFFVFISAEISLLQGKISFPVQNTPCTVHMYVKKQEKTTMNVFFFRKSNAFCAAYRSVPRKIYMAGEVIKQIKFTGFHNVPEIVSCTGHLNMMV